MQLALFNEIPLSRFNKEIELVYRSCWSMIEGSIWTGTPADFGAPFIGDMCRLVYEYLIAEVKVRLIDEAVARQDDLLFGFATRDDFAEAAFLGRVFDEHLVPRINYEEVQDATRSFLMEHHYLFVDFDHNLVNVPIKGVW